ncbi:MAG: hypothetical protein ACO4AI_10815 [Prochlorothrix sp.]
MTYTPKSAIFLLISCVTAIASVGSIFELSYGDPQLGTTLTAIILAASLPLTGICLFMAIRSVETGE